MQPAGPSAHTSRPITGPDPNSIISFDSRLRILAKGALLDFIGVDIVSGCSTKCVHRDICMQIKRIGDVNCLPTLEGEQ